MVSPKGHVEGAEESTHKTTTERDAQGRPIKVTDPLGHETKTTYDGDGNIEVKTDPKGHENRLHLRRRQRAVKRRRTTAPKGHRA
jgi:YD repeat-containing protein